MRTPPKETMGVCLGSCCWKTDTIPLCKGAHHTFWTVMLWWLPPSLLPSFCPRGAGLPFDGMCGNQFLFSNTGNLRCSAQMAFPDATEGVSARWDVGTQTPHGGQEWRDMSNFVEDFSVTTNGLRTPKRALEVAAAALREVSHYPSCDHEPACSGVATFLRGEPRSSAERTAINEKEIERIKKRLVLGNGASELIDLCTRLSCASTWSPGPTDVQYKEYERSAANNGLQLQDHKQAELVCAVNPCNPTGDFMEIEAMKRFIEDRKNGVTVMVDESMIFWFGPNWRSQSLVNQEDWVNKLYETRGIKVFVIHSWTKIWACPGLRVGSILAPHPEAAKRIRKHQVPWSLNTLAIAFLSEVVKDYDYMSETWKLTPRWSDAFRKTLQGIRPEWDIKGRKWLPFVWIDTKCSNAARFYVETCKTRGVPIRWGAHGYQRPTYIRVAVRDPKEAAIVVDALRTPLSSP
ncbi:aminotransferase, class I/II superfamily protein [Toxoplasma gondii CAST]|uniref:Aminotransferase, class I/II superfamily protein n=1 Tax=Toxoplasma gondii CAST TaxID=943122 RepID=A0A425I1C0_TOXGO|nr:aminotransferase, class I/II superfamily protein [Toxoplasma gondii CAST]